VRVCEKDLVGGCEVKIKRHPHIGVSGVPLPSGSIL